MTDNLDTIVFNTAPESTHPVLKQLNDRIAELEITVGNQTETIRQLRSTNYDHMVNFSGFKQTVIDLLTEGIANEDIAHDVAEKWAKDLDIELTREVLVSGTITFSGKTHVSIFEDIDRYTLMSNVSIDCIDISAFGNDLESFDYDLDDVEGEDA